MSQHPVRPEKANPLRDASPSVARGRARHRVLALAVATLSLGIAVGCRRDTQDVRGGAVGDVALPGTAGAAPRPGLTDSTGLPPEGVLARVAIGDLAGVGNNTLDAHVANPYTHDAAAIAEGQRLFVQMNCAGCHGYGLKGGMGPNLTDTYWRYGGSPADVYKTIYEGRPQGMPAWGRALTPAMIWKLTAYIESKGGTYPASMADRGRQGDVGDKDDTTAGSSLKGLNSEH